MFEALAVVAKREATRRLIRRVLALLAVAFPVVAVGALTVGMLVALMIANGGQPAGDATEPGCSTVTQASSASIPSLDREQLGNAATIVAVGKQRKVPAFGLAVAVATAMQESTLHNLPGGDGTSVGLFQQIDTWGTFEQRHTPAWAAGRFFAGLLKVAGWQQMPLTVAAQTVQRSAFPDAYAQWQGLAAKVVGDPSIASATCVPAIHASRAAFSSGTGRTDGKLMPTTVAGKAAIMAAFPGLTVGCFRSGPGAEDHAKGLACDFMIPNHATGQRIADFVQAAATSGQGWGAGVQYVIWRQHIWNVARASEGWRLMPDRGSPTANHMDHCHVSFR